MKRAVITPHAIGLGSEHQALRNREREISFLRLNFAVFTFAFFGFSVFHAAPPNEASLRNAEAFCQAGDQHRMQGEYDPAKTEYREALRLNPSYAEPHNGLGWIYYYSDSPQVAIREFKKATAIRPALANAHLGLGLTYKNVSKWKDAEKALRMAVRVWPYTYLPASKGDYSKAVQAAQGDPDYRQAMAELAEVLESQGKSKEGKLWSDSLEEMEKRPLSLVSSTPPYQVSESVQRFAGDGKPFRSLPVIQDTAKIDYPPAAREAGIPGAVLLKVSVESHGNVVACQIIDSSGNDVLDAAAKGIAQSRFSPPRYKKKPKKKGTPTCDLVVKVDFQILPGAR